MSSSGSIDGHLAVDFEITLAALLATGMIAFPNYGIPILSSVAAFGMLSVTLVRRMALIGEYADSDWLMFLTNPFVEAFTIIAVLNFLTIVTIDSALLTSPNGRLIEFTILCLSAGVGFVVFQEALFKDFANWWQMKFTMVSDDDEDLWAFAARISGKLSRAPSPTRAERRKARRQVEPANLLHQRSDIRPSLKWVSNALEGSKYIILPSILFYIMVESSPEPSLTGGLVIIALLLFLGMGIVEDYVKYLYLTYGNTKDLKTDASGISERAINQIRRPGVTQSIYVIVLFWFLY